MSDSGQANAARAYAAIGGIVFAVDRELRLTAFNPAFVERIRALSGEIPQLGMPLMDLAQVHTRSAWRERLELALEGETRSYDQRYVEKDGTEVASLVAVTPIRDEDGGVAGVSVLATDITKTKEKERHLTEQKIAAETAYRQATSAMDGVSHEFRTPLNGLHGNLAFLEQLNLPEAAQAPLADLRESTERLDELVERLLEATGRRAFGRKRSERLPSGAASFPLDRLIEEEMASFAEQARNKGVELRCWTATPNARVSTSEANVRRLARELLGDALAATKQGHIEIRYGLVWETRGEARLPHVHLTVEDSREVSSGDLPEGPEPFARLDVGLPGDPERGRLLLRTEPGHGARVHVDFAVHLESSDLPSELALRQLRVLLAEDNAVNARVVQRLLERFDVDVEWVEDGLQALEAVRTRHYDLILMDLQMPRMDGLEATRLIREAFGRTPPIVALTANCTPEDRAACFEAGMNAFVGKPLRPSNLQALLSTLRSV